MNSPILIPLPTGFPVGPVNVYLVPGDPLTLIDAGPKQPETLAALEAGLAQHGARIEDLRQLILTHHHVDHVGLARTIVQRSGARVVTHPYNVAYLQDYEAERVRQLPFYERVWTEAGTPAEIIQAMARSNEGIGRWLDPVSPDTLIDEGACVEMGGSNWPVYHTPGHAGGLVCLYRAETAEMVADDHFLRDISSNPTLEPPAPGAPEGAPRPRRLVEYLHHMRRMAALNPRVAYPGHGDLVDDVAGLVRKRQAFHQRRADKIHAILQERPRTLWEITGPMFPKVKRGMDFFLAHSEVLGHLDLLEDEGRVRPATDGPRIVWQAL